MKEKFVLVFSESGEKTLKTPVRGGFEVDIEETAQFGTKGFNVIVLSNVTRRTAVSEEGQERQVRQC